MRTTSRGSAAGGSVAARLFGPTVVTIADGEIDLGRRQVRQLVTALACRTGKVVSVDSLIDHLWSDELPVNPRQALNVALSRLRGALGEHADRVEAVGSGYRLMLDAVDLDVFETHIDAARELTGRDAVDQLDQALQLWVGEPFADDVDADLIAPRRTSLIELRWFALTRIVELLTDLGDHDRAVELAAPFVGGAEVRERLVVAHAVALAQSGRKVDALAVIAATSARLRNELGLEPSAVLRAAEREILAGSIDLAGGITRSARPVADRFVGRQHELDTLARVRPGVALAVVGEAGMGKSTLIDRYEVVAAEREVETLRVDVPASPDRPLGALSALCEQLVLRSGFDSVPERFHTALARICPDLGFEPGVSLTRDALVADVIALLEAAGGSVVFIVDDAHLLDGASGEVFEQLVERGRVSLVFGTRPTESRRLGFLFGSDSDDPLLGRCLPIELGPLTAADAAALMAASSSRHVDEEFIEGLYERAGGNALFLRLLIERWADGGDLDGELPSSVLVAVSERLDVLSGPMRQSLDLAAVFGRTFSMRTLRELRSNADVEIAAVESAGLVVLDPIADTGMFVHVLVNEVCYDLLPPGRRVELHDEIGRVLEWADASPAEYAPHHVAAARLDPLRAVSSSIAAAAQFAEGFDWNAALAHLDAAAAVASEHGIDDPDVMAQIVVRRGVVGRALISEEYLEDLYAGCEFARVAGNHHLFVVAVTELCGHGRATTAGKVEERVLKLLEEALEFDIAPAERAELCASAVPLFSTSGLADRGRALYHEAWKLASDLGDPEVEAAVVANAHLGFAHPDDFDLLVRAAERMTSLAGSDPELIWESAFVRFQCSAILGDAAAAFEALEVMRAYTLLVTRRPRDFGLAFSESAFASLAGDFEAAERFADEAFTIGLGRFDPSWATTIYGLVLLGIRSGQGRLAELDDAVGLMLDNAPDYLPFRAVAAMVATEMGDVVAARKHLDLVARDGFAHFAKDLGYTAVLFAAATAVADVGTPDEVAALTELLLPFSGRLSWSGPASVGPIDAALARLATAAGDDDAARAFQQAADELVERFVSISRQTPSS